MGLRFRKSIKICKGVKVNIGKSGASLSIGTKGLHRTYHTSGRVTTSVGIPGTGISWVDTQYPHAAGRTEHTDVYEPQQITDQIYETQTPVRRPQITEQDAGNIYLNMNDIREIYTKSDYPIDWTDISISSSPDDIDMDSATWSYCKNMVERILNGDIDSYLEVIDYLRPVDDLIAYAGDFEFGTDRSNTMSVEYTCLTEGILERGEQDPLYEELTDAVAIRIARDLMALLPVSRVNVFVVNEDGRSVEDITFTKKFLRKVNYNTNTAAEIVRQQQEVTL